MLPSRHILVSFSLAVIMAFFTRSMLSGLFCFASGVLIDIDHLIDYSIHFGWKNFNLRKNLKLSKEIYSGCRELAKPIDEGGAKKLYLFFHAIEFSILFWIIYLFSDHPYILAIAIGYSVHLIMDITSNAKVIKPSSYFIVSRIKKQFITARFIAPQNNSR